LGLEENVKKGVGLVQIFFGNGREEGRGEEGMMRCNLVNPLPSMHFPLLWWVYSNFEDFFKQTAFKKRRNT
jgi:hypothetical protein